MNLKSTHLCFVGNMLGRNPNYIITQGQIVADLLVSDGCQVTSVSSKINRFNRLADIVKTLLTDNRNFDLVLLEVYSGAYFVIADIVGFLCMLFKLPLIMVLHGGKLPDFIQKYPRWTKRTLNRADALVAPSLFLAEKLGVDGFRVQVIPNVIDLGAYPYRERSKISPDLIWMRSFHPIYNPEMAIKVLARLKRTVPGATLTMAGRDKGLEKKVRSLASALGISDSVRFTGFLDFTKKQEEFSNADIYINTNCVDNMPVSVLEARAFGLPVVATNVGGLPYLVDHGENGLLVPDEDVEAMVESIKMLLDDPELTRKISQNGRALAEHSAWSSVCFEWEKLLSRVLNLKQKAVELEATVNRC